MVSISLICLHTCTHREYSTASPVALWSSHHNFSLYTYIYNHSLRSCASELHNAAILEWDTYRPVQEPSGLATVFLSVGKIQQLFRQPIYALWKSWRMVRKMYINNNYSSWMIYKVYYYNYSQKAVLYMIFQLLLLFAPPSPTYSFFYTCKLV